MVFISMLRLGNDEKGYDTYTAYNCPVLIKAFGIGRIPLPVINDMILCLKLAPASCVRIRYRIDTKTLISKQATVNEGIVESMLTDEMMQRPSMSEAPALNEKGTTSRLADIVAHITVNKVRAFLESKKTLFTRRRKSNVLRMHPPMPSQHTMCNIWSQSRRGSTEIGDKWTGLQQVVVYSYRRSLESR